MKSTKLFLIISLIVIAAFAFAVTSCNVAGDSPEDEEEPVDITLTVNLANGNDGEEFWVAVYPEGTSFAGIYDPANLVAVNYGTVASGSCSLELKEDDGDWEPTANTWIADEGGSYDVYVYTDPNADSDNDPASGTGAKRMSTFPQVITMDEAKVIDADFTAFVDYPQNGTLTVNLSNGTDGDEFYVYVYPEGTADTFDPDNLVAVNYGTVASGTCSLELKEDDGSWMPTATTWTGPGGGPFDVYIYTDPNSDSDNDPATGTGAKMTVPFPEVITIDGNQVIDADFTTFVSYSY